MERKIKQNVEWLMTLWTLLFCLGLLAAFGWEYTAPQALPVAQSTKTMPSLIDLNTADAETLQTLSGIGPTLAERIIAYREETGGFQTVEEIMEVSGIGTGKFDAISPYITVSGKGAT